MLTRVKYPTLASTCLMESHTVLLEHKHSGIKYVTPDERHRGLDVKILATRKSVYRLAHQQHPERWSKQLRNWDYIPEVYLNPVKESA